VGKHPSIVGKHPSSVGKHPSSVGKRGGVAEALPRRTGALPKAKWRGVNSWVDESLAAVQLYIDLYSLLSFHPLCVDMIFRHSKLV